MREDISKWCREKVHSGNPDLQCKERMNRIIEEMLSKYVAENLNSQ